MSWSIYKYIFSIGCTVPKEIQVKVPWRLE
jgi:hypothetical protein